MKGIRSIGTARRLSRAQQGTAAVEFALVLPFLLLLLAGAIDFGRMLHDYQVVNKSIRDASRYLSRVKIGCPGPGVGAGQIGAADKTTTVNLALTGTVDAPTGPGDYLLGYWTDPSTITVSADCMANAGFRFRGVYKGLAYIPSATVTASVPFPAQFGGLLSFFSDFNLTVSHNEANVGE